MKKLLSIILVMALIFSLAACAKKNEPAQEVEDDTTDTSTAVEPIDINIGVLTGPTGIGAVELIKRSDNSETYNNYNFTVAAQNDEIVSGLSNKDLDIAAVATNVAANLYNKTNGSVKIIALNTYGVLDILENGDTIQSVEDLKGKTIYSAGQGANPEFVIEYILDNAGLTYCSDGTDPDADVTIEFLPADQITAGMVSGEYEVCLLPQPAVTAVQVQNADVRIALDLTEVWNTIPDSGKLTMGCVVVRTAFVEEHPEAVAAFLADYEQSINYVNTDLDGAAALCEEYGIVAKAPIAKKAIPSCNICFVCGAEMQPIVEPYYNILFNANADSIGGAVPDENIYFIG